MNLCSSNSFSTRVFNGSSTMITQHWTSSCSLSSVFHFQYRMTSSVSCQNTERWQIFTCVCISARNVVRESWMQNMCAASHSSHSCQAPRSDPQAGVQLECETRLAPDGAVFWPEKLSKVIGPVKTRLWISICFDMLASGRDYRDRVRWKKCS